jgi:hypothetical protein
LGQQLFNNQAKSFQRSASPFVKPNRRSLATIPRPVEKVSENCAFEKLSDAETN